MSRVVSRKSQVTSRKLKFLRMSLFLMLFFTYDLRLTTYDYLIIIGQVY